MKLGPKRNLINAQKRLIQIARFSSGRLPDLVVGHGDSDGRIIFGRSDRSECDSEGFLDPIYWRFVIAFTRLRLLGWQLEEGRSGR